MTTLYLKPSIGRALLRLGFLLIPLMLGWLALSPTAQAVDPSLPAGCPPNFTTAGGCHALYDLTTGVGNTGVGWHTLAETTDASFNTGVGAGALIVNNGESNTAVGAAALFLNTTGTENTAVGTSALSNQASGDGNTAIGFNAGQSVLTASNVICIGNGVLGADVSGTTWIGNVYGVTTQSGITAPVVVSADGQLGTVASSERFKKDIATMEKASEAILSLRPVTFRYKTDTTGTPQFGLIAEEVAKIDPGLVLPDKQGKPYTVRYDAVNAMLLNEFLKAHKRIEEQEVTIAQLKRYLQATTANQQKQIEALTAGLQKVSAQLAAASPSMADLHSANLHRKPF